MAKAPSYRQALKDARNELKELFQKREELERQIARARQTVIALGRMFDEGKGRDYLKGLNDRSTGLTGAIRDVLIATRKPIDAMGIRSELESVGYDIGASPNVLVSIHTILKRLIASGQITEVGRRITSGEFKGRFDDTGHYWWGEYGLPKGWSRYPDKRLLKRWSKQTQDWRVVEARQREFEDRARRGEKD